MYFTESSEDFLTSLHLLLERHPKDDDIVKVHEGALLMEFFEDPFHQTPKCDWRFAQHNWHDL